MLSFAAETKIQPEIVYSRLKQTVRLCSTLTYWNQYLILQLENEKFKTHEYGELCSFSLIFTNIKHKLDSAQDCDLKTLIFR